MRNFGKIFQIHNNPVKAKKCNLIFEKFNKDKLDNILSPATKEYLKLEKELKSMNNNIFKRNTR